MSHTLQSLVLPNLEVAADESMYLRLNDRAWAVLGTPRLLFERGGVASTDTFYNGLTVGVWRRLCAVRSLAMELEGEGSFVVSFGLHRLGQASAWLAEQAVRLEPGRAHRIELPAFATLHDGLLFARLRSLEAGVLDAARYVTDDEPPNAVRLGLVITHFDRVAQVMPAIERIGRQVLARPDLQGRVTLTVVDNSRNLPAVSQPGTTVITNRNFGGTGGFARGLLELIDGGQHSHALFMDDDASCESESIARSFALLEHARDPKQAVAGSLLREAAPWHLLEKGARFDHQVRPISPGLDMRRVEDLLRAERASAAPDYGAWWFFAFPLREVRHFPFPFFVRGDDIQFGLANRFTIATLNGVGCFGEDFGVKHSPLTAYLDARYHLVLALLDRAGAASRVRWVATRLFLKALTSYHYSSARAVTLALRHVMQGPDFFREHLDLHAVRAEIGAWLPREKLAPLDHGQRGLRPARRREESPLRRLARALTLQGFVLPRALLMDRTTVLDKSFHGRASAVFRYRHVLYEHAGSGTGYLAHFDRKRFFAELRAFVATWFAFRRRLGPLQQAYERGVTEMSTAAFWRRTYRPAPSRAPAPATQPEAAVSVADG
ncbi:MAG TPA: hypothetical protein VFR90_00900 [Methylibium sp.]|uniref:hypothetical protein n=1 Tax=Methylibium sp. TaxID=2067992 RepID=UPI002DBD074B|nr:hypothetical protein [Methylibium sp.]HEU4457663.1 hypothetical protein [Methylibium sp.]